MDENNEKKPLDIQEGGGEKETHDDATNLALGLCFGSAVGLLLQIITGDIIWLPICVAIGNGLGFAFGGSGKKGE